MSGNEILIVDDEMGIRELLSEILQDEGYRVKLAENAAQARTYRNQQRPDLVLLDIWMPDCDGITLLKEWARAGQLTMPVVMMSGHATIDTAVEATRIGALDFMEKPIALQKLLSTVQRALKRGGAQHHPEQTLASLGKGEAIVDLKAKLDQVLQQRRPVLLTGEYGVAFEPCARYLYTPNSPWVTVSNPQTLIDAPLSLLEQARDGLLYVPEVAELPRRAQQGLMLVVNKLEKFHARLVVTSSQPLLPLVTERQFDAALYQALAGLTVVVPPLRLHADDVPDLANQLLTQLIEARKAPQRRFATAALNQLRQHGWQGNHQELLQVVQSAALTASEEEISADDVQALLRLSSSAPRAPEAAPALPMTGVSFDQPLREARDEFERLYLEYHLKQAGGNMSQVAERVGLERTHLYRKLKQLGVQVGRRHNSSDD
ncbi:sigma-54-dependent transcriptional regulator [Leeia aquatica]|uniref:Sigma-54-dependent Fis family transcriptional regulator n=1 Tax=Leeia aquatica TaxID=2725557 RepID=A0A847SHB2_9NEIS|nr:sigma-54 dependent transcriptional regulator [Leeia aquatica]NLR76569.1 sigma-54-dependent Fis family transcriptional regulator [Leeia aquatica]